MPLIHLSVEKQAIPNYEQFKKDVKGHLRDKMRTIVATIFLVIDKKSLEELQECVDATEFLFSEYGEYDSRCKPITFTIEADWSKDRGENITQLTENILETFSDAWPQFKEHIQLWVRLMPGYYITEEMMVETISTL